MRDDEGMLFVYREEKPRRFWMKNTFIPLSIGLFNSKRELIEIRDMAPDTMVPKGRKDILVKDLEANPVEAGKAAHRADPQITIPRLQNAQYGALREALVRLPRRVAVLGDSLSRVERPGRNRRKGKERRRGRQRARAHGSNPESSPVRGLHSRSQLTDLQTETILARAAPVGPARGAIWE